MSEGTWGGVLLDTARAQEAPGLPGSGFSVAAAAAAAADRASLRALGSGGRHGSDLCLGVHPFAGCGIGLLGGLFPHTLLCPS